MLNKMMIVVMMVVYGIVATAQAAENFQAIDLTSYASPENVVASEKILTDNPFSDVGDVEILPPVAVSIIPADNFEIVCFDNTKALIVNGRCISLLQLMLKKRELVRRFGNLSQDNLVEKRSLYKKIQCFDRLIKQFGMGAVLNIDSILFLNSDQR